MISPQPQRESGSRRRNGAPANGASPESVPPGIQTASWEDVSLADIDTSDLAFQYRFPSEVASIRQSLQAEGQREPIDLVGKRPFQVVDGFRRIMAASELGWTKVKAFVHGELPADEAYRIAFTKNVVRRNLRPLERAQAMIVALKKRGLTEAQLRTAFGISEKQVKRYLALLEFAAPIQQILDGEVVTMAHAKALADFGVGDDALQWKQRIQAERPDGSRARPDPRQGERPEARGAAEALHAAKRQPDPHVCVHDRQGRTARRARASRAPAPGSNRSPEVAWCNAGAQAVGLHRQMPVLAKPERSAERFAG